MPEQERELQDLGWCIVEVAGHRKLGAQVREIMLAGAVMARCDIPGENGEPGFTQFYGGQFLFCVTPTTETLARTVAARYAQPPVSRYELPAPRTSRPEVEDAEGVAIYDDGEPWEDENDGSDEPGAANPGDEIEEALDDLEEIPSAPSVEAQVQPDCGHNPPDTSCPICYPF